MSDIIGSISNAASDITAAGDAIIPSGGGGGSPESYINMIMQVGQYSASVSALAGATSAVSGALQGAASKVGS